MTFHQLRDIVLNHLFDNGVDIEWAEYAAYYDDPLGERQVWIIDDKTTIHDIAFLIEQAAEKDIL